MLLFPTQGVGMQEALKRDIEALHAAFSAFNTWLDEDWGFDRDGDIAGFSADEVRKVMRDNAYELISPKSL